MSYRHKLVALGLATAALAALALGVLQGANAQAPHAAASAHRSIYPNGGTDGPP